MLDQDLLLALVVPLLVFEVERSVLQLSRSQILGVVERDRGGHRFVESLGAGEVWSEGAALVALRLLLVEHSGVLLVDSRSHSGDCGTGDCGLFSLRCLLDFFGELSVQRAFIP